MNLNKEGRMQMKNSLLLVAALVVVAGCKYGRSWECATPVSEWPVLMELPRVEAPSKAEILEESGSLALFVGETAEDAAFNEEEREAHPDFPSFRNSLFLRRRVAGRTDEWRLILTTGSDWRAPDGLDRWCSFQMENIKRCFFVRTAHFSADGRHLWIVCYSGSCTFTVVCSYDVHNRIFRALIDGDDAEDASDGTIRVEGKKFYPNDDLGAAWHDVWITPDGKIVREGGITLRGSDL